MNARKDPFVPMHAPTSSIGCLLFVYRDRSVGRVLYLFNISVRSIFPPTPGMHGMHNIDVVDSQSFREGLASRRKKAVPMALASIVTTLPRFFLPRSCCRATIAS